MPTIMLSQFVLNFSTGVLGSDGKDLCFSLSQDLHSNGLEALTADSMNCKFIVSVL